MQQILSDLRSPVSSLQSSPSLSVFIPARNEAGNIPPLMEKLARTFVAHALDAEVIFVDDSSRDETWN